MQTTAEMERETFSEIKSKILRGFIVGMNVVDAEDFRNVARTLKGLTSDAQIETTVNSLLALTQKPSCSERVSNLSHDDRALFDYWVAAMTD